MARQLGAIMVGVAAATCLIGSVYLAAAVAGGRLRLEAALLGFGALLLVLVAPLSAIGIVSLARGRREDVEEAEAERMRTILDMVKARGRVSVSDVIVQLGSDQPSVQALIYRLVGMGVFSGYINWDEGVLYSAEAAALHELSQCKHCGGNLTLAGKGVIKCPFCGTEYFLAK